METKEMASLLSCLHGMRLVRIWRDGKKMRIEGQHPALAERIRCSGDLFFLTFDHCTRFRLQMAPNSDLFLDDLNRIPQLVSSTAHARPGADGNLFWDMKSGTETVRILLQCAAIWVYDSHMDSWTSDSLKT